MAEKSFEQLVKTEDSALAFFKRLCWENYRRFCVRCHSYQFYRITGNRYRCKRCGYTFHDYSGRWINKCKIGSRSWLMIVKTFEMEHSARQISKRVALSYPTALKAVEVLRLAIIANSTDAEHWLDHVDFHPEGTEKNQQSETMSAVYGIIDQLGKVKIDILEGFTLETELNLKPKMLRRSSIYFTDAYPPYAALVFHDHAYAHRWVKGDDADPEPEVAGKSDFWRYAKTKIARYRGISNQKLPQYLKELEFRYNHPKRQVFDLLCRYLVSFVPKG
jgi:transposase